MSSLVHSPHAHAPLTVGQVMRQVMLALAPATLYGFWLFGWPAINLWVLALLAALLSETLALKLRGRSPKGELLDGSAVLTAWLLALSLPPWAPWWIAALGSGFAVIVGKQIFGGLGQNLFNPAMIARVMLLIAFPLEMTTWIGPLPMDGANAPDFAQGLAITFQGQTLDGVTSASVLGQIKTEFSRGIGWEQALGTLPQSTNALFGQHVGSLGETSALWLCCGGLILLLQRGITWHAPVAMLLGVALPALSAHGWAPERYPGVAHHLLSGGVMLAAFFIVTDPVTSPNTSRGQFIFGLGAGLLTWIIRSFGGYPEGVAFAILLMNAVTPVIDQYVKPRIYGRGADGRPLPARES